jgi:hypothetical protein
VFDEFCERLDYDLLFRWFLDMGPDDEGFDASTFAKNKERLLQDDVARMFSSGRDAPSRTTTTPDDSVSVDDRGLVTAKSSFSAAC